MTKSQIFMKWTMLVWLNAAFSFVIALSSFKNELPAILGMTLGVFTFVGLYSFLDYRLMKQGKENVRDWLLIGVIIKMLTQFFPMIEIGTGMAAMGIIESGFKFIRRFVVHIPSVDDALFISTYLVTVIDGVLLSLVIGVFVLFVKLIATRVLPRFKKAPATTP